MPDALDLLTTRHSYKPIDIAADKPGPSAEELDTILTVASRVPDHGKLAPWRFIVISGDARRKVGEALAGIFKAHHPEATSDQIAFEAKRFLQAPVVIAVVSRARPHPKIPEWEQELSAGASAMTMLLAAYALGYVGCWLTDWIAYDADAASVFNLETHEKFAGFIYLGQPARITESRPRPDLADIVTYFA